MKKKVNNLFALFLVSVMFLGILTGCGSEPAEKNSSGNSENAGTYKLTVASFYATMNNHGLLGEAWCNEITKRTDGRVEFDYYPGASLVNDADSLNAIKNGIADIAMYSISSVPGLYPAMSYMELPRDWASGWVGTMVANEFIKEFELPEYAGVKPLYVHTVSPAILVGTKQINAYTDFSGTIIRTGSSLGSEIATAIGAQNYSCQITEVYEALTKGMCDFSHTGYDALYGFNLNEIAKYVHIDGSYGKLSCVNYCMNEQKWNSLPDDIKQVFEEVSAEFAELQGRAWLFEEYDAMRKFQDDDGGTVMRLDKAGQKAMADLVAPVIEKYIKDTGLSDGDISTYSKFLDERIAYYNSVIPSEDEILAWGNDYLASLKS